MSSIWNFFIVQIPNFTIVNKFVCRSQSPGTSQKEIINNHIYILCGAMPLLGVITIRFFLHFQNQIAVVCKYALFWRTKKALHQRVVGKNEFLHWNWQNLSGVNIWQCVTCSVGSYVFWLIYSTFFHEGIEKRHVIMDTVFCSGRDMTTPLTNWYDSFHPVSSAQCWNITSECKEVQCWGFF